MDISKKIVQCPSCPNQVRIPVMINKIRFKCPFCEKVHCALNGEVLEDESPSAEVVVPDPSKERKETTSEKKTDQKKSTELADPIVYTFGKDKQEEKKRSNALLFWKMACIVLGLALIILNSLYKKATRDYAEQDKVTREIIVYFQQELTKTELKDIDFDKIKVLLTPETRKTFEMFIESQFLGQDTISQAMIKAFANSLEPMDLRQTRRFRYKTIEGDTSYFRLEYVPDGMDFLFSVDMKDFVR